MVLLKGMTWDHARGIDPLKAATQEFSRRHPDINIIWDARSLKDFEDFPVDILAKKYDLLMIDHPFIGEGVSKNILEAYDDWLSKEFLADQATNSVGPSHFTYQWEGKQWALAVDTAAQVSAYRADLLNYPLPVSWDDVFQLVADLPAGRSMGLPLVPTHAYASFVTLNANIGGKDFWQDETEIRKESGLEALALLKKLAGKADPRSFSMNPIHMLDVMATEDSIVYTPLIYGYSNYARPGYAKHIVKFGNIPSQNDEPRGSMIGGVGLAVSAYSKYKREAMAFAEYAASAECQTGIFYTSGGQPGHRAAWIKPEINHDCNGFFSETLKTLELSYVRPRKPNYNRFQENAGEVLQRFLLDKGDAEETLRTVNKLFAEIVLSVKA